MIKTPIQVRFADCDIAGHIHNAAYLHYFETGRMNFFVSELGPTWDWKKYGIILKKNIVEYHVPGRLEDQMNVNVSCSRIGTSSFSLTYQVINHKDILIASGESVLVCFDYTIEKVSQIPEIILKVLKKHLSETNQA